MFMTTNVLKSIDSAYFYLTTLEYENSCVTVTMVTIMLDFGKNA